MSSFLARWREFFSPQQSERTERQQARRKDTSEASGGALQNRQKSPRPTSCCLQLSLCFVGTVHVANQAFGSPLVWTRRTRSARVGLTLLGANLVPTPTPMEKLLSQQPGNTQLARKTGVNHLFSGEGGTLLPEVVFPLVTSSVCRRRRSHADNSRTHHSEPCNLGALNQVYTSSMCVLGGGRRCAQGGETRSTAIHNVIHSEIVSAALPGRPPNKLRGCLCLRCSRHWSTLSTTRSPHRTSDPALGGSWWLLVQMWGTMRFCDHRGLVPKEGHP